MTQRATTRRGARPPALLACTLLALCTASCAFIPGGTGNQSAPPVKSIEAFQRDIEPAIIAARNELVTEENFMAYKDGESIASLGSDQEPLYSLHTRLYYFTELDVDHIRDTYNKHLLPLGFELSEKRWKTTGPETVSLLWINEEYHAVVSSTTRLGEQTATYYYTQGTPSDGSTGTPPQLIDQPGRIPDWFDPNLPPAGQG